MILESKKIKYVTVSVVSLSICRELMESIKMVLMIPFAGHPRSKRLLIFWLHSPSAVILESKKIKSVTVSIFSPFICHKVMGLDAMIFVL